MLSRTVELLVVSALLGAVVIQSNDLVLDGEFVGETSAPDGGNLEAWFIPDAPPDGGTFTSRKSMGRLKCSDVTLERPAASLVGVTDWLNASFNGKEASRSIQVRKQDDKRPRAAVWRFTNCVPIGLRINGGVWPGSPEEMARFARYQLSFAADTGTFSPEPSDAPPASPNYPVPTKVVATLSDLDGSKPVELAIRRHSPIEIRKVGKLGEPTTPYWHIDDLSLHVPKAQAMALLEWYESLAVKGDPEAEKMYRLSFQDDAGNAIVDINIRVGIVGLSDAANRFRKIQDMGENDMALVRMYGDKKTDIDVVIRKF